MKKLLFFLLVIFVSACKHYKVTSKNREVLTIDNTIKIQDSSFLKMIQPYGEKINAEMNKVLVFNEEDLNKSKPEGKLGNLIADITFQKAKTLLQNQNIEPDFCILNNGGLRASLPKGDINVGNVFELMPFENSISVVKINHNSFVLMINYLKKVNGQPISGLKINYKNVGYDYTMNNKINETKRSYWVVTSDYLASGGDDMIFLTQPLERIDLKIKLRDVIIQSFEVLGKRSEKLTVKLEGRITYE